MHLQSDVVPRRNTTVILRRAALSALSLLFAASGCDRTRVPSASAGIARAGGSESARVPVFVATVMVKRVPLRLEGIGVVEPIRAIAVRSLVAGTLVRVNFEEGSEVRKGDLLFEIDARPYQNALHAAEADLEKTKVQLKTAETQVERYTALTSGGMISREQFETLQSAARVLKAALTVNAAALANARLQLEDCSIHAPCDGRTGLLGAHEGDLVRASDPNVTLVTVTQLSPIYVSFSLAQQSLASIQSHYRVAPITVSALVSGADRASDQGSLSFIDSAIDGATGTIRLRATFSNPAHLLWPGQFARVALNLATVPDQIVVPTPAVQIGQRGSQVYVIRKDLTAELRSVTVERAVGNETVVATGLAEGERVVVDGHIRLRPNAPVSIQRPFEDESARHGPGANRNAATITPPDETAATTVADAREPAR